MAREAKRTRRAAESPPAAGPPRWPVWAATAMTLLYLAVHAGKVPAALRLWGGIASALVMGK